MFLTTHTAHFQHLSDCRADALRALEDARMRLDQEVGHNVILAQATGEVLRLLQEQIERCRDWCPNLFGPDAVKVDEVCRCWQCTWIDEDPFAGCDEPG